MPLPKLKTISAEPPLEEEDKQEAEVGKEGETEPEEKEESLLRKGLMFLYELWLNVVDSVIEWLELNSADYQLVVYRLKQARYQPGKDELLATVPPIEEEVSTTETSQRPSPKTVVTAETEAEETAQTSGDERPSSVPEDDDHEPEVKSKHPEASQKKIRKSPSTLKGTTPFDEAGDTLISILKPSAHDEQQAQVVETKLGGFTRKYTERPKRFLSALYYWSLSHFEYVVFLFVIIAIISTGAFTSFIYAGLLFLWGLLSLPIPTKRFWLGLIFYTMVVMIMKYIYLFILVSVLTERLSNQLTESVFERTDLDSVLAWIFGVQSDRSYFVNGVVNLLLLMVLMFQRGLLKVHCI